MNPERSPAAGDRPVFVIHAYHITPKANLARILKRGLMPKKPLDMDGEPEAVFLFVDETAVEEGFATWYCERFPEDTKFALLTVDITGIATIEGAEYEHVVPTSIPADRILAVRDYD